MAQGLAPEGAAPSPGRYRGADSVDQNRSFQADTAPRAGPFNLNNRKPRKGAVSRCAGCGPAALTSTMSTTKKGAGGVRPGRSTLSFLSPKKVTGGDEGDNGPKTVLPEFGLHLVYFRGLRNRKRETGQAL